MKLILAILINILFLVSCDQVEEFKINSIDFDYSDISRLEYGRYEVYDSLDNGRRVVRKRFLKNNLGYSDIEYFTPKGEKYAEFEIKHNDTPIVKLYYQDGSQKAIAKVERNKFILKDYWNKNGIQTVTNYNGSLKEIIDWRYIMQSLQPSREEWSYNIKNGLISDMIHLKYFHYQSDRIHYESNLEIEKQKHFTDILPDLSWNVTHNLIEETKPNNVQNDNTP